jgi:hypothetical protein
MATYKGASRYGTDEPKAKPRNDAYTGLLIVSFLAMIASCVLLFIDWSNYGAMNPPDYRKALPPVVNPAPVRPPEKEPEKKEPEKKEPEKKEPEKKDAPKAGG